LHKACRGDASILSAQIFFDIVFVLVIKQFLANPQMVVTGATITGNRVSKLGKTRTAEAAA